MLADELRQPSYGSCPDYAYTRGPQVVELCQLAGFIPDPEQELGLDWLFAVDDDDNPVAFEFAVLACRQNLKTGLFKMAALGWLFVTDQRLIVWSAHEFSTAQEAHRDMCELIKGCESLDALVANYYYGNGDESIELISGARLLFKARTKGGGRGLSGDKVVLDEAYALQPTHIGSLMPLLRTRKQPQLVYGSSAPRTDSLVLHDLLERGRAGTSKRLAYLEWSAPEGGCELTDCDHKQTRPGCALDDEANWLAANTAYPRRIKRETFLAEREGMPVAEFGRELLGWPDPRSDSVAAPIFGAGNWEACKVPVGTSKIEKNRCFGIAVSIDRKHAAIGAAGFNDAGRMHLEPVDEFAGLGLIVARAAELQAKWATMFVIDGAGPAASLIPALERAGVTLTIAKTGDVTDAFAEFYDAVQTKHVAHLDYPELNSAVDGATSRLIGDRLALKRRDAAFNIAPLEAAELASWGSTRKLVTDYDLTRSFY